MLISVIIPAFNCQDTLANAVKSVIGADFSSYEIIIIDDGSQDGTPAVISSLKEKYEAVKSIRTQNGGPAKARNAGLNAAKGEYIMFLDSDDEYEKDIFSVVAPALNSSPDLVIFGFRQRFAGKAEDKIYSPSSPFDIDGYYKNNLLNQVWNKAYKKSFLDENNIRFSDYRYGEDRIFNGDALLRSPVVEALPQVLYSYNIDGSVSLISGYTEKKFDACKEIYAKFSFLCNDARTVNYMFLKNVLSCMTVLYAGNCRLTKEEKRKEAEKIITDETVKKAMKEKQDSAYREIIRRIIATQNISLNLTFAKTVAICQKKFLPIFLKFRG